MNEINGNVNRATKLMRLYNESLESLTHYRRKGQQKITVQHVNVSDGGQAIVGNVKTGEGDNAKTKRADHVVSTFANIKLCGAKAKQNNRPAM